MRNMHRIVLGLAMVIAVAFTAGCSYDFVTEAARNNAASFLVDIFATAVDATVGP